MFRPLLWSSSGRFIAKDVLQKLFEPMHKFGTLKLITRNVSVFYTFNAYFKPYILKPGTLHLYIVSIIIANILCSAAPKEWPREWPKTCRRHTIFIM